MASQSGLRGFTGSIGLLLLRVGAGGAMAFTHGLAKLTTFSTKSATFPDPIGLGHEVSMALAIFAEFFCSLLVIIGLKTRFVAIPVLFTMLVAFFRVHGADVFSVRELAFVYGLCFLTLVLCGGGRYSADSLLGSKDY